MYNGGHGGIIKVLYVGQLALRKKNGLSNVVTHLDGALGVGIIFKFIRLAHSRVSFITIITYAVGQN